MHIHDENYLKENILSFGLYKHNIEKDKFDYDLTCIHECKYWTMYDITKLQFEFKYRFKKELHLLKPECYYIITVRQTKYDVIEILEINDVTEENDDNLRTH